MKPGPKKKSNAVKLLAGNPGHRPLVDPPEHAQVLLELPSYVSDAAIVEWNRIMPLLQGRVGELDQPQLIAYCVAYGRWIEAEQTIAAEGMFVESRQSMVPHPAIKIANDERKMMMKIGDSFGFSPLARGEDLGIRENDRKGEGFSFKRK